MDSRKRKHSEFASDLSLLPEGSLNTADDTQSKISQMASHQNYPDGNTSGFTSTLADSNLKDDSVEDGNWELPLSKKAKKKKRKQEAEAAKEAQGPSLAFPNKVVNHLRVKDLQALVLYVLSDGVAPTWVSLKNGKQINQVLVLMVPGMDKDLLDAFISSVEGVNQRAKEVNTAASLTDSFQKVTARATDVLTPKTQQTDEASITIDGTSTEVSLFDFVVPVKAPGDPKTGKVHSPLQAMLISPEPKAIKDTSNRVDNVFAPVRTPITEFVHSADELVEAEYPVHPSLFTDSHDGDLERIRRESTGQSQTNGWVDTAVASSMPVASQESDKPDDLSQGMQVYALDCEMVLTTDDVYSLARISVLDWNGKVVLDKFVRPHLPIKDYFTAFSGITEKLLEGVTTTLEDIQQELLDIFTPSTILLGQSLESDFSALKLTHPFVVDTSMLYPHPRGLPLRSSLKFLANKYLKREIQKGGEQGHDSVEDARAVLDLVKLKCEKGPKWGTVGANGESIFGRLRESGCRTAIVEHGNPQKGMGRLATIQVGCENDEDIVNGIVTTMSVQEAGDKVNFVWARLRDMEKVKGWNSGKGEYVTATTTLNGAVLNGSDDQHHEEHPHQIEHKEPTTATSSANNDAKAAISKVADSTAAKLARIYDSLPTSTLLILFAGPGDMREVYRLQEMQKQYKKEFKVKKWDELSVKWTDEEAQALRKAFQEARNGWGLVCLK